MKRFRPYLDPRLRERRVRFAGEILCRPEIARFFGSGGVFGAEVWASQSASLASLTSGSEIWIGTMEPMLAAPQPRARARASPLHSARWRRAVARGWTRKDHIHNRECRSAHMELRRTCPQTYCRGKVVVSLCGNLSEILVTSKGSACCHSLNELCRRARAFLLAANVSWVRRHVASQANAADFDSRLAELGSSDQPRSLELRSFEKDQPPTTPSAATTS